MTTNFRYIRFGRSRLGRLTFSKGEITTPLFMPVATKGSVKGILNCDIEKMDFELLLHNLYHLAIRPGVDVIESLGGIHKFVGWKRFILTDSGGYQVFSLAKFRRITAEGVEFRSYVDGSKFFLSPELVVEYQERIGVDIAMVLDVCPEWGASFDDVSWATNLSNLWAVRSIETWKGFSLLFAIVQGGEYLNLREKAVKYLSELPFSGYAIGGVSVGEPREIQWKVVEYTAKLLPEDRPRYLMGVGYPVDILFAVLNGVDMFDCVLPSRNGRHGVAFVRKGTIKVTNSRFAKDLSPLDSKCECKVCKNFTKAFIFHMAKVDPYSAGVYVSYHNLYFYSDFVHNLRKAIRDEDVESFANEWLSDEDIILLKGRGVL